MPAVVPNLHPSWSFLFCIAPINSCWWLFPWGSVLVAWLAPELFHQHASEVPPGCSIRVGCEWRSWEEGVVPSMGHGVWALACRVLWFGLRDFVGSWHGSYAASSILWLVQAVMQRGRCLVFDDSYEHEAACNCCQNDRVIAIKLVHPCLMLCWLTFCSSSISCLA